MWIDSHCHLNDEAFQADLTEVIEQVEESGVEGMIVAGYDLPSSIRAVELASKYRQIWAAVGIHPHDAKSWEPQAVQELERLLQEPCVVAVGEIGLDYHYNFSEKEDQHRAFREQLMLAGEINKPVIIHDREAHGDTMKILDETGLGSSGGVMHCFAGSREFAGECLKKGLYLSFSGSITFKNAHKLASVVETVPLEKVLVETDSPYLTPHPFRGQRNNPSLVRYVGEKLAEIKHIPVADVMRATSENTCSLFRINRIRV